VARAVSLSVLEQRVLQRANLEGAVGASGQKFIQSGSAELDDVINESIAALYDEIRSQYGQDYYVSQANFNTVANQDTYSLPADFLNLLGVDVFFGTNLIITARPYMWTERNRYKWYPGWIYTQPVFYRLFGSNIKFIPTPSGAFAITLNYVPVPTKLVNPTDAFDGINGWEEWAVLDAAIKLLVKDGDMEMIQVLTAQKADVQRRLEQLAGQRDAGNPERVQDITLNDGWVGRPGF
jgi:hypothetical protein